jgi:hypothetical protein
LGNTPKLRKVTPVATPNRVRQPRRWLGYTIGLGILAVIVLLVYFVSSDVTGNPQGVADPPPGTETIEIGGAGHTSETVDYGIDPPVGGFHDPQWLTCGAYDQPVRNENAVHALEHGAIWIAYQPDLDPDAIDQLERYARRAEVIVSPYPGIDSPIVLSAWGRRLELAAVDDALIDQFYRAVRDRTSPEPGASC